MYLNGKNIRLDNIVNVFFIMLSHHSASTSSCRGKRVYLGLSGGVDSAVSAYLLKEQGYDVHCVFMRNWHGDDGLDHCPIEQDLQSARSVAQHLDLPLEVMDFSAVYWEKVFQVFLDKLALGVTPNPDVLCNQYVKFGAFLEAACSKGAKAIATGHYASIGYDKQGCFLKRGLDKKKDQSYFLALLNPQQLEKVIFPLGMQTKEQVRDLARQLALPNHNRKDSMGICFIGKRCFPDFIQDFMRCKPGNMVSTSGKTLGLHKGLACYTIGQRKGLGLGGGLNEGNRPWYVVEKDVKQNILVLASADEKERLSSKGLICQKIHWIREPKHFPCSIEVKIRHQQQPKPALIDRAESAYQIHFNQPAFAVTAGQIAAVYQGDMCLGAGEIVSALI